MTAADRDPWFAQCQSTQPSSRSRSTESETRESQAHSSRTSACLRAVSRRPLEYLEGATGGQSGPTRLDENRMRPEGTHTRSKGRYYLSCELNRTVNRPACGQFLPSLTCVPLWASTLLLKKTTLDQGWRGEGSPAAVTGHPETVYGSPRGPAVSQRTEKHAVRCLWPTPFGGSGFGLPRLAPQCGHPGGERGQPRMGSGPRRAHDVLHRRFRPGRPGHVPCRVHEITRRLRRDGRCRGTDHKKSSSK